MSQNDKNQESEIQYDLIGLKDLDEVNDLLVNEFFRNEPLGKHLGANPEMDVRPWISKVTQPLIAQGVSWKAFETKKDGNIKIVGALMNKVVYKDESQNIPGFAEALEGNRENFMWDILNLMDQLYKDVNLFDKFNVDKMVVFNMISVHKDYGGQGIGRVLAQKSEDFLKNGKSTYNLVSAETTGALSAKVFQKQGFEQITQIVYEDYRDKKDKPVFQNISPPHTACIVWAKHI